MLMKTVTVTYDPTMSSLSIDPPSLVIEDGDWVVWDFRDVPSETLAHIFFLDTRFGPFELLRLLDFGGILGEGKIDLPGISPYPYTYRALLLNASGVLATGNATLINLPQGANTSPDLLVECFEIDGSFYLNVNPMNLYLFTGDTATWHILNVPEGYFVTVAFYNNSDPRKGPFQSFSQGRVVAGAPDQFRAVGTGFAWDQPQLQYTIELRDAEGNLVDKKDPMIDNLGDPPTGGG